MAETTLAAALTDAFDKAEVEQETAAPVVEAVTTAPTESAEQTAQRQRDEKGRFAAKDAAAQDTKPATTADAPPVLSAPTAPERKPPSSWKKDYWDAYKALPEPVANYINERESQFANGVSTYKAEADRAREVQEALAPFAQDFQRAGVSPAQGVAKLAATHRDIVNASPEAKIQIFQRLAQEYGVSMGAIQQGQPDQVMQYLTPLQQEVQAMRAELNSSKEQKQQQEQTAMQTQIQAFAAEHEHFELVKETMSGLLQSGLAQDLKSAYDKAIRLNDNAWQAEQHRLAEAKKADEAARVAAARAKTVSPRSATPTSAMTVSGKKDVRSTVAEAVDQHWGGRV